MEPTKLNSEKIVIVSFYNVFAYKSCFLKACVVQPKSEMDLQFESTKLSTPWGYLSAVALCVATFGTIALMSGFFLKPDATIDDYIADVIPLFGGFLSILGVSEVCIPLISFNLCDTYCKYSKSADLFQ